MNLDLELDIILDDQRKDPVCFCPICGSEIYGLGGCLRCERRKTDGE